jgi:rhodanese-related sulfurtransferase
MKENKSQNWKVSQKGIAAHVGVAAAILVLVGCQALPAASPSREISAQELRAKLDTQTPMTLVFASKRSYFANAAIQGAIPEEEFRERIPTLPKDSDIVLYCGCPQDAGSLKLAAELRKQGFVNVKVLQGGIYAWLNAGFELTKSRELTAVTK